MAKTGKKRKKNRKIIIAPVIIAALVILLAVGVFGENTSPISSEEYFGSVSNGEAAVMINGKISKECGVIKEGEYYIPYDALEENLTSGFYLDAQEGVLYKTTEYSPKTWQVSDGTGALIYEDRKYYINADCVSENTSLAVNTFEAPDRIIITGDFKDGESAVMTKDANVHYRADKRSRLVTKAKSGDHVRVIEDAGDWSLICTDDGYGGYIKKDSYDIIENTEAETSEEREFILKSTGQLVKMVWFYSDNYETNDLLEEMMSGVKDVNIICPTWYCVADTGGNITDCGQASFVERAHGMGLDVWIMLSDYSAGDHTTGEILESSESRKNLVEQVINSAVSYGADGINVDFEVIRQDNIKAYLQFLRELTLEAHANNLIVSTDNYVPTYTLYYDRAEQAKIADYIVVMAYDEHTSSSGEAGSVASLSFVRDGIEATLKEGPNSQLILGVPFYTRGWVDRGGVDGLESSAMSMADGAAFAKEHGIELVWDEDAGQYTGSASDSEAVYSIWLEDKDSIEAKLMLVSEYDLAGASGWRLGKETDDIWETWARCLK